jgi:hypothetical protein
MKEPKRYDFRQDGYTLQVLQTDSKYNKNKILKYCHLSKVLENVKKKKSLHKQPKQFFFLFGLFTHDVV